MINPSSESRKSQDKEVPFPSCNDKILWELWLSRLHFPALVVADRLKLFSLLNDRPSNTIEIAESLSISTRGAEALLGVLVGLGFVQQLEERFFITEVSREFLLPESPYYWGGVFRAFRKQSDRHSPERLLEALHEDTSVNRQRITFEWDSNSLTDEQARLITGHIHGHSFPSAMGFARRADFDGVLRLLDIGGGSGCFSIAAALHQPNLSCTVVDLQPVCIQAESIIREYNLCDRIEVYAANFFRDPWPDGHNAVLLSNILHDWEWERCQLLLQKAFNALPPGGRVFIHEVLLNDGRDASLMATSFSLQMVLGTHGKQFTASEISELLNSAGFINIRFINSFGYFWTVTADKL
ncbi:MAG: methyltransferase domain-containing protein [Symploca sp. SIO1C2]|nr:methyltransferase domain-containing protein [Symploca sp. SIO1C2]